MVKCDPVHSGYKIKSKSFNLAYNTHTHTHTHAHTHTHTHTHTIHIHRQATKDAKKSQNMGHELTGQQWLIQASRLKVRFGIGIETKYASVK